MRGEAEASFSPPAWALWPPMRFLPEDKKAREEVVRRWANLIFEWASAVNKVVIDLDELARTPPFDVPRELLRAAAQRLVQEGKAKWREKGKVMVIFWRSRQSWAQIIYKWLKDNFKEVFSLHELAEVGEDFSELPIEELEACLKLLEKSGLVKRVRKVRGYYKLVIPGVPDWF